MKIFIFIGLITAAISVLFVYLLPMVFYGQEITLCNHQIIGAPECIDKNVWMGSIIAIEGQIGFVGLPLLLGIFLALKHRHQKIISLRPRIKSLGASIGIWWLALIIFEIIWLQPWHNLTTPAGITYNAYQLDAVFGTPLIIPIIMAILMSYLITAGICSLPASVNYRKNFKVSKNV